MGRLPYPHYEDPNFAAAGKPTINVFKLLSYAPSTVDLWTSIGNAHFTKVSLTKKQRELVILLSAAKFGSYYEWTHHIPLSERVGVSEAQRQEIRGAGRSKGWFGREGYWDDGENGKQRGRGREVGFEEKEGVLLKFLEQVIDTGEVEDVVWKSMREGFGEKGVMEVLTMQGFYYTLARVTTVCKIDMEGDLKPRL